MAIRPRYRVSASDGKASFQLHVKAVIESRTVERRDLYELLKQADFEQRVGDAFRRSEEEVTAVTGIKLEDLRPIRYRAGSIVVLKSYVAHFDSAPYFNAFFYDSDRNLRDIEEIFDTRLRAELSYLQNIAIATAAYATLGVVESEALPAPVAETEPEPAVTPPPEEPATSEPQPLPKPDFLDTVSLWVNRAIAWLLIALLLWWFLWYVVNNLGKNGGTTPTRATDIPYEDIPLPRPAPRQISPAAHQSASCDAPKLEAGAASCTDR